MKYLEVAQHYDECFKKHGDSNLGVDWPNHEDTLIRHEVMSDIIKTNNPTWFPTTPGRLLPTSCLALVDPNFKMPQIIRLNVATDIKLKNNYILTLEAIYNKDINAVFQYDANLNNTTRVITEGNSTRPYYTSSSTRRFNTATDNVTVLSNTNKGEGFIFTTQIQKNFANGLYIMAAYTGSNVSDVSNNPGSRAISAWQSVANSSTPNTQVLGISQYCVPHRIVASISKKINWNNFTATTISAFYEGSTQGRFSYIYSSDINGDNSNADLIYVPNKASDLTFTDITGTGGVVLFSKQDQMEAFQKYIDQDKYLSTHKGGFADKSGAKFPWYHRLDLRILQDFNIQVNGKKHTIQFSADMLNALNFINKDWGIFQELNVNNAAIFGGTNISEQEVEHFRRMMQINLTAPLFLIKAAFEELKKTGGCVLNIGSINAHAGESKLLAYSISKGGMQTMTRNLANANGVHGIRVNQINPGWVLTEREYRDKVAVGLKPSWPQDLTRVDIPSGTTTTPEQMGEAAIYWLGDESKPFTGSVVDLEQFSIIGRNPEKLG